MSAGEDGEHVQHLMHGLISERASDNRFLGKEQNQIQTIQVVQVFWHIVANHSRRLGIILRQSLCHFDDSNQVFRFGSFVFERIRQEDRNAG